MAAVHNDLVVVPDRVVRHGPIDVLGWVTILEPGSHRREDIVSIPEQRDLPPQLPFQHGFKSRTSNKIVVEFNDRLVAERGWSHIVVRDLFAVETAAE